MFQCSWSVEINKSKKYSVSKIVLTFHWSNSRPSFTGWLFKRPSSRISFVDIDMVNLFYSWNHMQWTCKNLQKGKWIFEDIFLDFIESCHSSVMKTIEFFYGFNNDHVHLIVNLTIFRFKINWCFIVKSKLSQSSHFFRNSNSCSSVERWTLRPGMDIRKRPFVVQGPRP